MFCGLARLDEAPFAPLTADFMAQPPSSAQQVRVDPPGWPSMVVYPGTSIPPLLRPQVRVDPPGGHVDRCDLL